MAHRIFTGPFSSIEERLLDLTIEQQAGDELAPVAVLVGSNLLASYLKTRIAVRGRAAANVRYYTFPDLVAKLCACRRGSPQKPRLPHLGASLLLADILEAHTPEVFGRVAGFAGFRAALLDTFRDLRDAGITPEALDKSVPELTGITPDRAEHLLGLSLLYRVFRTRVSPFLDTADDFRRAAANAPAASKVLGTRWLSIYGIYDVTGVQAELLLRLGEALDLAYFIPFVSESASRFAVPFLESRIKELGVAPVALPQKERKDGLGALMRRVFAAPDSEPSTDVPGPVECDGAFSFVSVPGESRAAVEVIREVLGALRAGVIAGFYEAAVILRHPDEEVPILGEAFRLRRIPYFVHGGSAFNQRPLARAVLAIAGLQAESFSRRAILTAMDLTAAALPAAATSSWDVQQWRALVNDPRFLAGVGAWDAGTTALVRDAGADLRWAEAQAASGEEEEEGDEPFHSSLPHTRRRLEAALRLQSGWAALRQAAAGWPAACTWREWTTLLQERLGPLLGRSQDWSAFSTVFDDLAALGELPNAAVPERQVTRARIVSALAEALEGLSQEEGRFQRRGINLLSATAARGLRFPLVVIPGLEEGRFPSRLRQDPLLLDAERQQIGRPPRLPLKSLRAEEERLLFDMAVRSATKRLVLLTSRLDESSDRERIPSQFFLRCAAAARGASLSLNELNPENVPGLRSVSLDDPGPGQGQAAVDKGEIRLGLIAEDPACARAALSEIAQVELSLLTRPMAYDRARWVRELTEFDGRLDDPALWQYVEQILRGRTSQLSASRIEEYAKCPYLFYLRRVQELRKWEEEEWIEGMDPRQRGKIVHEVLESFLQEFSGEKFAAAERSVLEESLSACARSKLELGRPAAIPDLLWEIERDRLLATLAAWLEFEKARGQPNCLPLHFERVFGTFGGEAGSTPYRLQGQGAALEFRGRIDRIDIAPDGLDARVVDYKTGVLPKSMRSPSRSLLMAGEKIQLAVYCGALVSMPDLAGVRHIEGEYLHLQTRDGSIASCAYDHGELRAAIQRLPEMLEIVLEGMRRGVFFARAHGRVRPQGHCDYCDFLTICGKDRQHRQAHKSADPAVVSFSRLQEIDSAAEDEE
jgi:ATP-dependent helicase/nuclease subunit B